MGGDAKMILTVNELAKLLRLNPQTIYRKVESGEIPYRRVDNSIRFDSAEIDRWILNNTMNRSKRKGVLNGRVKQK